MTPHTVVAQCCARQDWASLEVFARHGLPLSRALRRTVTTQAARAPGAAERVFAAAAQWERDEREREAQALRSIDALLADMGERTHSRRDAAARRRARRRAAVLDDEEEDEEDEDEDKSKGEEGKKEEKERGTATKGGDSDDHRRDGGRGKHRKELEVLGLVAAAAVAADSGEDQSGWVRANQRPRAPPIESAKPAGKEQSEKTPKKKKKQGKKKGQGTSVQQEAPKQQQQKEEKERREQQCPPAVKREEPPVCAQQTALEKRCAELEAMLEQSRAREHELEQKIAELEQRLAERDRKEEKEEPQPQPQPWGMLSMTQWLDEHANTAAPAPFPQFGPAPVLPLLQQPPQQPPQPQQRPARPQPSAAAKAVASAFDTLFADDGDYNDSRGARRGRRRTPLH